MAGDLSWKWRLAGWLRALPEFRGRDRLSSAILRGAVPPAEPVRCVIGHGLTFDARMREDGSWVEVFFLQYEAPSLAPILEAFLTPGASFIDVGANIGVYTGWASRLVGREGRVVAFEPAPATRRNLEGVVAANALANVTIIPKALGDAPGTLPLWVIPQASGLTSAVAPAGHPDAQRIEVPVGTLDDEIDAAMTRAPSLIKIDVEGYEISVLRGASRTLAAEDGPAVLFETQTDHLARAGERFADVPGWFEDRFGYRLFGMKPAGLIPIPRGAEAPPSMNTLALHPVRHAAQYDKLRAYRFRRNQTC